MVLPLSTKLNTTLALDGGGLYGVAPSVIADIAAAGAGGAGVGSEFWQAPATAHANDREMVTLPTGWALYKIVSQLGVLTTPNATAVDPMGKTTTATACRVAVNTKRRSWLLLQPPSDATSWFYGFKIPALTSNMIFRARLGAMVQFASFATNAMNYRFTIYSHNAAGNVLSQAIGVAIGWASVSSALYINSYYWSAGSIPTVNSIPCTNLPLDAEFVIQKVAGVYQFFLVSQGVTFRMGQYVATGTAIDGTNPVWAGFEVYSGSEIWTGVSPTFRADYYREESGSTLYP